MLRKILAASVSLAIISAFYPIADAAKSTQPSQKNSDEKFLEKNKKKPGVILLADGLQYKILIEGKGPKPTAKDTVTVDYTGTKIDGSEFDNSCKRGQPATFPVTGVIPGWTEALQLMPLNSTWIVYVPPSLAYGKKGAPPAIGPNQALIFKIHLIGINK